MCIGRLLTAVCVNLNETSDYLLQVLFSYIYCKEKKKIELF